MTLKEYFALPGSPAPKSPVGSLMQRILAESPEFSFEDARQLARNQLFKAAGRKNYRITTPKQDEARAKGVKAFREKASRRVSATRESGKSTHSS